MEIVYKTIDELIAYENNPRINDKAVLPVANSIKEFGFDIQRLAVYFKVSIPAMFYRLTNLGFLLIS